MDIEPTAPEAASIAQQALLAKLQDPRCYPHAVADIERIETHISTVLLTGRFAYKFKKPVDLGFLDFTTLTLRRHYCEEELRLNRRLAPELYLNVVAVCGDPPRVCAADAGGAIEYAVKMRQFDQRGLLDRVLVRGELLASHIDALATSVADFHAHVDRSCQGCVFGLPATQEMFMRQNFAQIRALTACDELDAIERWSIAEHAALAPLMAARHRDGFVRECHGDLHLGNIAMIDGAIRIFDCIEFNPDLRWCDVANEVAFLVMDFAARGHDEFAARFFNAYLEITGDYAVAWLLPCYLAYRAMVRAKVACIRAHQAGLADAARADANAEFGNYLRLATSFTRTRWPCLIITHGVSGSGKTTVTQPLLERLGALRVRSDLERKRLHGMAALARSGSAPDAGLYAKDATQATYDELYRLARELLATGWPVIVDATFLQRRQRDRFRALAAELQIPFLILDCHADVEELRRRVARRTAIGTDASEATLTVLERQLTTAEPLSAIEITDTVSIDTLQADIGAAIERILSRKGDVLTSLSPSDRSSHSIS